MKKILILGTFILIIIFQMNAQIGNYYNNVQRKNATIITGSNTTCIETYDNKTGLTCNYWFSDTGVCDRVALQWDTQTHAGLIKLLNDNKTIIWSKSKGHWYFYQTGQDGVSYYAVGTIEYDTDKKSYINVQIR